MTVEIRISRPNYLFTTLRRLIISTTNPRGSFRAISRTCKQNSIIFFRSRTRSRTHAVCTVLPGGLPGPGPGPGAGSVQCVYTISHTQQSTKTLVLKISEEQIGTGLFLSELLEVSEMRS